MRRAPIRRRGRRAQREAKALKSFRGEVWARAEGQCQYPGCQGGAGLAPHHMKTAPRVHDPDYGRLLCWAHHRAIHDHSVPDWRDWFASVG